MTVQVVVQHTVYKQQLMVPDSCRTHQEVQVTKIYNENREVSSVEVKTDHWEMSTPDDFRTFAHILGL